MTGPVELPPEFRRRKSASVEITGAALPSARTPQNRDVASVLIAIVFGLAYGWDLLEAIANLVGLMNYAAAAGYRLNSFAWIVLGTAIAVPPLCYGMALGIGRRRGPARLALVLFAGLGVSACASLTLEALVR